MKRIISLLALCLLAATAYCQSSPKFVAAIAGKDRGTIKRNVFVAQLGIIPHLNTQDTSLHCRMLITEFTIKVIRNGQEIYTKHIHATGFDEETHNFFQSVRVNDVIRATDIRCRVHYYKQIVVPDLLELNPIELTVI